MQAAGARQLVVTALEADNVGGFTLHLRDGLALDVFPDGSARVEHWRLITRTDPTAHFVVEGDTIDML